MKLHFLRNQLKSDLSRYKTANTDGLRMLAYWCRLLHPRMLPILFIRLSIYFYDGCQLFKWVAYVFVWLNVVLFGIECTPRCKIGLGLCIPHSCGIVIGAYSIGDNVTIFQGVTLGASCLNMEFGSSTRPTVSNGVTIGSGAKLLGGIVVAADCEIGANAVVTRSTDESSVYVGVPARKKS